MSRINQTLCDVAFSLPDISGRFDGELAAYLRHIGQRRPLVMFAFPPKAAGTFLRSAAVDAVDGQLIRLTHAQGGRDGTPYLPTLLLYYEGWFPLSTLVTHIHMQALPSNRHLLEAFDIKPVIMIRDVSDMLSSYLDMLNSNGSRVPEHWLNCSFPSNFEGLAHEKKVDFLIDFLGPWYASYYATWLSYAEEMPGRVCVLQYPDFRQDPAKALETALRHSRVEQTYEHCQEAVRRTWDERQRHRFNKGYGGRGKLYFDARQMQRLEHLLFDYHDLANYRDAILPRARAMQ
ncbi:MAG: sulfotransferase domain-containing protein [Alphaproteobacteria bacterium]|nr:sulfotransferase domain-containing protein [Alphaproteobacteria bacterium]